MDKIAYAALWLFVFTIPWERMLQLVPGTNIATKVSGALALGFWLFNVVISGRFRRWHAFHTSALLFLVYISILTLVTVEGEFSSKYWTFLQLFLMLWMIWDLAPNRGRLLGLFSAFVLGASVSALQTIFLYLTQGSELRRFAAGGADPNDLAMILALALPMAWYLSMSYRTPLVQWVCRAYLMIAVIALGLTGSRGGMVAAMVALLVVPLTLSHLSPGKRVAGMVLMCMGLALAISYTPATLVERFASTGAEVSDASLGGRGRIWYFGLKAFAREPFFGYGTGEFRVAVAPWGVNQVAHNAFLSVLVEEGLVGLLIYLAMFVLLFFELLKLRGFERRFSLVLFATLIVAMLPLTWEDRKVVWFIMAALVGLCSAPSPVPQAVPWRPPRPVPLQGRGVGAVARGAAGLRGRPDGR